VAAGGRWTACEPRACVAASVWAPHQCVGAPKTLSTTLQEEKAQGSHGLMACFHQARIVRGDKTQKPRQRPWSAERGRGRGEPRAGLVAFTSLPRQVGNEGTACQPGVPAASQQGTTGSPRRGRRRKPMAGIVSRVRRSDSAGRRSGGRPPDENDRGGSLPKGMWGWDRKRHLSPRTGTTLRRAPEPQERGRGSKGSRRCIGGVPELRPSRGSPRDR